MNIKKYFCTLPMVLILLYVYYDAGLYLWTQYLRTGQFSVGMFAPFTVFCAIAITVVVSIVLFVYGIESKDD